MQKIKESFQEVISGQPSKQHYTYVSIIVMSVSLVVALVLTIYKIGQ